jgi:hypothetical protein
MKPGIIGLVIIFLSVLAACHREPDDMKLVGYWHLYNADLDSVTLSQSFLERAKATLESTNYNFLADKNFQIIDTSSSGGSYSGVWEYSSETRKLTLFYPELHIDPEEYEVIRLTRKSLIIKSKPESYGFFVYKFRKIRE